MCSRSVARISMLVRLAGVSRLWHSSLSHRIACASASTGTSIGSVRSASTTVSSTLAHSMSNSNGEITAGSMFGARAEEGREAKPAKKGGRARHPVKAAALQLASGPDKSANLETATRLILKAKSLGAEVCRVFQHTGAPRNIHTYSTS